MKKQPTSTQFKFVLSTEETLKNLDELKLSNYQRFVRTSQVGKKIQQLAKANLYDEVQEICNKHLFDIPFLKFEIEDAFVSSFNLRNFETSKYFLDNGFQLNEHVEDAVISIAYSLQYLIDPRQAPLELLELVLQYGANPRYCQSMESNTAMHLACQAGNLDFIKLIVEYGADLNAVSNLNYQRQMTIRRLLQGLPKNITKNKSSNTQSLYMQVNTGINDQLTFKNPSIQKELFQFCGLILQKQLKMAQIIEGYLKYFQKQQFMLDRLQQIHQTKFKRFNSSTNEYIIK